MTTISDLCDAIRKTLGVEHQMLGEIASCIGLNASAEATVESAADLLIAFLAADGPANAAARLALCRPMPLSHVQFRNALVSIEHNIRQDITLPIEDLPLPPGNGEIVVQFSRSFADALGYVIRKLIADPRADAPTMIRVTRRDTAPYAFITSDRQHGSEEILLYRRSGDEDGYQRMQRQFTILGDAHGVVFRRIADVLRGTPAQSAETLRRRTRPAVAGGRA